jgi:Tfp pilus assembly protein PilF
MIPSRKELRARLKHTLKALKEQCETFRADLNSFIGLTDAVCVKLRQQRTKLRPNAVRYLEHWWNWLLVMEDRKLELINGELRHQGYLQRPELPYKNNFDLKEERYYKGSEKDYSGAALDDLRDVLKYLGDKVQEDDEMRFSAIESTLDELPGDLNDQAEKVRTALKDAVGASKFRLETKEYERLDLPGLNLRRPKSSVFKSLISTGIAMLCESSDEEEAEVHYNRKKTKKASNALSDSDGDDDGEGGLEIESVDAIKRAAGVDVDARDEGSAFLRAEEERTERPLSPLITEAPPVEEWNRLGKEAEASEEWAKALKYHQKDFEAAKASGDYADQTMALKNMGLCNQKLRDWDAAAYCLTKGLEIACSAVGNEELRALEEKQQCLLELGNLHIHRYDELDDSTFLEAAIVHYKDALDLARSLLARNHESEDKAAESRDACARALYNYGDAVRTAEAYTKAQTLFREAIAMSEYGEAALRRADYFEALGDVSLDLNEHGEAISAFNEALQSIQGDDAGEEVGDLKDWPVGNLLFKLAQTQLDLAADGDKTAASAAQETLQRLKSEAEGQCSAEAVDYAIRKLVREEQLNQSLMDDALDSEDLSESEAERNEEEEAEESTADAAQMSISSTMSASEPETLQDTLPTDDLHNEHVPLANSDSVGSFPAPAHVFPQTLPPRGFQNGGSNGKNNAAARKRRRLKIQMKVGLAPRKTFSGESAQDTTAAVPTESAIRFSWSSQRPEPVQRVEVGPPPAEWTHVAKWNRDAWQRTIDSVTQGEPLDFLEGHASERALFQSILKGP